MSRDVVAVVVNFNSGPLLKEAVDSLLAGTLRPDVEVVDNASTDQSADFLKTDPRYRGSVRLTLNKSNLGFSRANNQVLRGGSARYYLLMNPDCVLGTNALAELVAYMDANPNVGLAGGALMNRDGTLQKTSKRKFPTPWSALARTLGLHRLEGALGDFDLGRDQARDGDPEWVEAVSGALMFVRGAALGKVGLLDEGFFMHCEDLDWCMRFRVSGYGVAYVPAASAVHVKGGSGRGARVVWHLHRGMIRFYRKHYLTRYPRYVSWLVYPAVYARCGILMALSLVRGRF